MHRVGKWWHEINVWQRSYRSNEGYSRSVNLFPGWKGYTSIKQNITIKWNRTKRSMATYFWQNTCSLSWFCLSSLSSRHIQNYGSKRGWRYLDIMTFKWTSRMTGIRNCCSPRWPDRFMVQDTNLMHPPPTVQTFNKPENRDRRYIPKLLNLIWFNLPSQKLIFDVWRVINLQFRVQCVILLLFKLILVNRSGIN